MRGKAPREKETMEGESIQNLLKTIKDQNQKTDWIRRKMKSKSKEESAKESGGEYLYRYFQHLVSSTAYRD